MRIIVEGWRFLCHSYAVTNQFQLLEMVKRPDLEVWHRDMPYLDEAWQTKNSFGDRALQLLSHIPTPSPHQPADVTLRVYCPWNLEPSMSRQTWVFAATEWGVITNVVLKGIGVAAIAETSVNSCTKIVTPSHWSKEGLIRSGVHPSRIAVVPLGADTNIYYPLSLEQRQALRKAWGWEDKFVFLNIGGCTDRKGIRPLLKAFAAIVDRYPQARLVLKASEKLYPSRDEIAQASQVVLNEAERVKVAERLTYTGTQLSFAQIAQLYQAADAYVSPYLAEGFNLPVLEAAACGLPVICTKGGATDDFIHPDFALPIDSKFLSLEIEGESVFILSPNIEHLIGLMQSVIEKPELTAKARYAGPRWVANRYTWKHAIERLLQTFAGKETRTKIEQPAFEPIIL